MKLSILVKRLEWSKGNQNREKKLYIHYFIYNECKLIIAKNHKTCKLFMKKNNFFKISRGFTIIELIVVMVLVAILALGINNFSLSKKTEQEKRSRFVEAII